MSGHTKVRAGTQVHRIMTLLESGPLENAQICDEIDEIGPYLSRTMAKLKARGLVVNLRPGKGKNALYARATEAQP